jgi:phosphinothricin acetyltransferase
LIDGASEIGVTHLLASISSLNEGSIRFHKKHGFKECGKFEGVIEKKGITFDVVWMMRVID